MRQTGTMFAITKLVVFLALGVALTGASLLYARKTESTVSCEWTSLNQVERGFPFPMIEINPSVSLCNSVESITVLWRGNAIHQQMTGNAFLNVVFWSVTAAAITTTLVSLHRRR